jgi:hypothetical protein
MRRIAFGFALLLAASSFAATPYFLDRSGLLWKAAASQTGLVLTAEREGNVVVRSEVPFELGLSSSNDTNIQVAADELTGKVAVVWQRNWSASASQIMVAVWQDGQWDRVDNLSGDVTLHPRNPVIQLSHPTALAASALHMSANPTAQYIEDTFLNIAWWQGESDNASATYAGVRLTGTGDLADDITHQDLGIYLTLGLACQNVTPADTLEYPQFAEQTPSDRALVLFASPRTCLFHLVEIDFRLVNVPSSTGEGGTVIAQRKRQVPIFGVRQVYAMPDSFGLDNARILLDGRFNPVAYRVSGDQQLDYTVSGSSGWSGKRTLSIANDLTLDRAIRLVENLTR